MTTAERAQAVVFLHGNLSRGDHWRPQIHALQAVGLRCHAPDQRGFGDPPAPGLPSSLLELADDVAAWCETNGLQQVCVVGISLGGAVAQAFAVRHPGRVQSLLLAGSYRLDKQHPVIEQLNAGVIGEGPPRVADLEPMVRASFSEEFQTTHPDVVDRIASEMLATQQATLEATVHALDDFAQIRAADIEAPTIVLAGARDILCPPVASRHLCDAINGAHYVELPTGHLSNLEAPAEFSSHVAAIALVR